MTTGGHLYGGYRVWCDKVKADPRLPFGLPGVNKSGKVQNGNYLWISYFYSYLNEKGRAGFVMSSQASSAGRDEAKVRQKLVETGDVDIMIAIRPNFFYTRTVPCELWYLNRAKPEKHKDKEGSCFTATVLECNNPHLLRITWGVASEVTFELAAQGKETKLVLTHRKLPGRNNKINVSGGWHTHLEILW